MVDSSFQNQVHVEGLFSMETDITETLSLKVWMLDELGSFTPLDKSLVVMVADALLPHVLQDPDLKNHSTLRQLP